MVNSIKTPIVLVFFACIMLSLSSCLKDTCESTQTYVRYDPIYITYDELRENVQVKEARELENPGKIYYYNNHIIVNEIEKGIHIIDNNNPSNPTNVAFLEVAGNGDFAVKNNILYADNYTDLVVFDISTIAQPIQLPRVEDVFNFFDYNSTLGLFVGYNQTEITEEIPCNDPRWISPYYYYDDVLYTNSLEVAIDLSPSNSISNVPTVGTAGSLSRFAIADCNLYCIDDSKIDVYDITINTQPNLTNEVEVAWDIETLFPFGDYLFVGSQSGMYIFDNTTPNNPSLISSYEHLRACDPVFVKGNYAYVTLRDGTDCQGFFNQLEIIDVTDIINPSLVRTYELHNPAGLSIKDDELYICDGEDGLKVFDLLNNGTEIEQIERIRGINAFDVINIPNSEVLLVSALDGIYQYDISDANSLKELSVITKAK